MKFIKLVKANKLQGLDLDYYEDWTKEEKSELEHKLGSIGNYGKIYFDDLEELADELGFDPIKLQDVALDMGFNVE